MSIGVTFIQQMENGKSQQIGWKGDRMRGDYETYYITKGPIRGTCKHRHRNIYWAYHCLRNDFREAQEEGIFSDRRVYAVENRHERELYEHEINELDHWKRVILKKAAFQQQRKG